MARYYTELGDQRFEADSPEQAAALRERAAVAQVQELKRARERIATLEAENERLRAVEAEVRQARDERDRARAALCATRLELRNQLVALNDVDRDGARAAAEVEALVDHKIIRDEVAAFLRLELLDRATFDEIVAKRPRLQDLASAALARLGALALGGKP